MTTTVTQCGRICWKRRKIKLTQVFAGQNVGVTQVNDLVWLVTFMHYDLGYLDQTRWLEPIGIRSARKCCAKKAVTRVSGMDRERMASLRPACWNQIAVWLTQLDSLQAAI